MEGVDRLGIALGGGAGLGDRLDGGGGKARKQRR